MIIIRYAQISDLSSLLPLMEQLGYPATLERLEKRFKKFIANEGYGVVVACHEQKVVGWLAWSKSDLFVHDASRFHIEGLVVDNGYRNMGAGKKLMQFVEMIASNDSPAIIDLTSGLRRAGDGTHAFYKKLGYQNDGLMAKLYLRKEV